MSHSIFIINRNTYNCCIHSWFFPSSSAFKGFIVLDSSSSYTSSKRISNPVSRLISRSIASTRFRYSQGAPTRPWCYALRGWAIASSCWSPKSFKANLWYQSASPLAGQCCSSLEFPTFKSNTRQLSIGRWFIAASSSNIPQTPVWNFRRCTYNHSSQGSECNAWYLEQQKLQNSKSQDQSRLYMLKQ